MISEGHKYDLANSSRDDLKTLQIEQNSEKEVNLSEIVPFPWSLAPSSDTLGGKN